MTCNNQEENGNIQVHMESRPWGNPIDVPDDSMERYYLRQEGPEKEESERAILIKPFNLPMKSRFRNEFASGRSRKAMSISTLRSTQQRRRRRRRRQLDLNVSTDCSLEGHYNFMENSSGFHSTYRTKTRKSPKVTTKKVTRNEENRTNTLKAVENSGLVNTKIGVYEKNLGNTREDFNALHDSNRKLSVLGVPLVGMHNSGPSTFPVVATVESSSWQTHSPNDPLQQPNFVDNNNTIHFKKGPSAISLQREKDKSLTKRRAPSVPNNIVHSDPILHLPRATTNFVNDSHSIKNFKKSSLNSAVAYPTKFTKNPYLTTRNRQPRFERDFYQVREPSKVSSESMQPHPIFVSLRSSGGKRKTLYAKDADGEEAIRVLTNLCVNPLARNSKRASFMMW